MIANSLTYGFEGDILHTRGRRMFTVLLSKSPQGERTVCVCKSARNIFIFSTTHK